LPVVVPVVDGVSLTQISLLVVSSWTASLWYPAGQVPSVPDVVVPVPVVDAGVVPVVVPVPVVVVVGVGVGVGVGVDVGVGVGFPGKHIWPVGSSALSI